MIIVSTPKSLFSGAERTWYSIISFGFVAISLHCSDVDLRMEEGESEKILSSTPMG